MKIHLSWLGCKLNQAEAEAMARGFVRAGHELTESLDDADVHVVNSCTVTHLAARDSRKLARRALRTSASARTVLTGCYSESSPAEAGALPGVELIVPNAKKDSLVEVVCRHFEPEAPVAGGAEVTAGGGAPSSASLITPVSSAPLPNCRTRAALKIEDGCNMTCAFCIIPSTRGRQRSRPLNEIVDEMNGLVARGAVEVVVTGVQISSYRHHDDRREKRLYDVARAILEDTDLPRLRLSSIAPWQFDRRLLELFESPRLCRHFHLSLQSGCDETLREMRRPYTTKQFADLVEQIRLRVPGVAITTDVITGFPGETDLQFDESLGFVEEIGFSRTHAFTYSERPGTRAAERADDVPHAVKKERTRRLREVGERSTVDFVESQLGESLEVLWETPSRGVWRGTSDNYVRVQVATPRNEGALESVRLVEGTDDGAAWAEPIASGSSSEPPDGLVVLGTDRADLT